MEAPERQTLIYRSLSGAPRLLGLPIHVLLLLVMGGTLLLLVANLSAGPLGSLGGLLALALAWSMLSIIYSQDPAVLPYLRLRLRHRFRRRISSFVPSCQRVRLLQD